MMSKSYIMSKISDEEWTRNGLSEKFTPDGLAIANSIREFVPKLHQELRKECTGDFVYSPLGVSVLLAMTNLASAGTTKKEITEKVGFPDNDRSMLEGFKSVLNFCSNLKNSVADRPELSKQSEETTLDGEIFSLFGMMEVICAQKIILQTNYMLKEDFATVLAEHFDSKVDRADFKKEDHEVTAMNVNTWVATETKDRVKFVLPTNSVKSNSKIIMVNAVHFCGMWKHKFLQQNTKKRPFYLAHGTPVEVNMMESEWLRLRYAVLPEMNAQVLFFPMSSAMSDAIDMIVLLPHESTGLAKIESKLENVTLSEFLWKSRGFYDRKRPSGGYLVKVLMPKIRIVSTWNLKTPMKNLGMGTMFKNVKADFGAAVEHPAGLLVSAIHHKTVLTINEYGIGLQDIEVGEKTVVETMMDNTPEEIRFIMDRPFFFELVQRQSGLPLLTGVCHHPNVNSFV